MRHYHILVRASVLALGWATVGLGAEFKAAVATGVITPTEPTWLGGYASRTEPADGKIHDLHAKVLALQDQAGYTVALLTIDTENVPRAFADGVAADLAKQFKLRREQVVISCSHTHSGPALASADAEIICPMTPEQYAVTERYTEWLRKRLVALTGEALRSLAPADLTYDVGRCGFGVNRRNNKETEVGTEGSVPVGPVDHDVPVLCVRSDGKLKAVLFGYACHCTTLNGQQWCGDWAGFAKLYLEEKHPGATAVFVTGCGGDTNPLPRRKLELCQKYGRELADAVDEVVNGEMRPIGGELRADYRLVPLAFEPVPSREVISESLTDKRGTHQRWASRLIRQLDEGKSLPTEYAYPVQAVRLGDRLNLVVLAGEVVVDYSIRLKQELGKERTWVFAYCNDVCAYIPSERVLKEGGYEGRDAMVYYGHASAWAPGLEEKIVGAVRDLVKSLRVKQAALRP